MHITASSQTRNISQPPWIIVGVALLILFVLALGVYHFHDRPFRQDEAWRVHFALTLSMPETLYLFSTNLYHLPVWQLLVDGWITLFGHAEPVTRYMSLLTTALTCALLYRMLHDLFDAFTGLAGVFLFGTSAIVMFLGFELRPYPILLLTTVGSTWCFLRWLRRPRFRYMLGYVALAGFGLVVHYYGFLVVFGHVLYFVVLVRWDRGLYLRALGLFALTGLTFVPWVLPMLHKFLVQSPDGIDWYALETNWDGFQALYDQLALQPEGLGTFLLLLGAISPLAAAPKKSANFRPYWRRGALVARLVGITALACGLNAAIGSLTSRNMVIIVPALAGLAALGLRALPGRARWLAIGVMLVPALTNFREYSPIGPHLAILDTVNSTYENGAKFVLETNATWVNVPINYYLTERFRGGVVAPEDIIHLIGSHQQPEIIPGNPPHNLKDAGPDALAEFSAFIDGASQIWWIRGYGAPFADAFAALLREDFEPVHDRILSAEEPYVVTEYRRKDTLTRSITRFGEAITLLEWETNVNVGLQPCDLITVRSTWQTAAELTANYSLSLVLTADGNGIANVDQALTDTPTARWQPGETYTDMRPLQIPCETGSGAYPLLLTVYDYATVERLLVSAEDGTPIGEYMYLTTVEIR